MKTFALAVLSLDRVVFKGSVVALAVEGPSGFRSFEAGHENFMVILRPGSQMRWTLEDGTLGVAKLETGIASFVGGACTVTGAFPPAEVTRR